jgi:hypothetical protein
MHAVRMLRETCPGVVDTWLGEVRVAWRQSIEQSVVQKWQSTHVVPRSRRHLVHLAYLSVSCLNRVVTFLDFADVHRLLAGNRAMHSVHAHVFERCAPAAQVAFWTYMKRAVGMFMYRGADSQIILYTHAQTRCQVATTLAQLPLALYHDGCDDVAQLRCKTTTWHTLLLAALARRFPK